jgi:hypothetical protein
MSRRPVARGPLRPAAWIAEHLAGGVVTEDWIRRHLPGKRKLGKVVVWYEEEARTQLAALLERTGGTDA